MLRVGPLMMLLALSACVVDRAGTGTGNSGALDAAGVDAAGVDAAGVDAAGVDSGAVDSGAVDSGRSDAGAVDAGRADAARPDAGRPDAGCGTETCNGIDDDCDGVIDNGAGCPCDHHVWEGHSYLICERWDSSWWSARDRCREAGYELATVGDVMEHTWIAAHFGNTRTAYWIGLHDHGAGGEGDYRWVADGSPLGYSNWAPDEPNNFLGIEDCVVIGTEAPARPEGVRPGWNDVECDVINRYVCEAGP